MASDITPEAIGFLSAVGVFIVALAVFFLFINKKLCFSRVGGLPCLEHNIHGKKGRMGVHQGLVNSYGDDDDATSSSDSEEEILKQFEISLSRSQSFRTAEINSGKPQSQLTQPVPGRHHKFTRLLSDKEEGSTEPSDCEEVATPACAWRGGHPEKPLSLCAEINTCWSSPRTKNDICIYSFNARGEESVFTDGTEPCGEGVTLLDASAIAGMESQNQPDFEDPLSAAVKKNDQASPDTPIGADASPTPSMSRQAADGSVDRETAVAQLGSDNNDQTDSSSTWTPEQEQPPHDEDPSQAVGSSPQTLISKCGDLVLSLEYSPDMEKLVVCVITAQDVPDKARSGMDSWQVHMVLLPSKKQRYKTSVQKGSLPHFNETFRFSRLEPSDLPMSAIRFRLYALGGRMSRERMMGEKVLRLGGLNPNGGTMAMTLVMEPRSNLKAVDSQLSLSAVSQSDSASSTQSLTHGGVPELLVGLTYNATTGRMSVELIKGSHFRNLAINRPPDTYGRLALLNSVGQEVSRCKTSVRRGQPNPVYKETFVFQVALFQLSDVTLLVSIYNRRSMKRKEMVGWISLGQNSSGEEEQLHWQDMKESRGQQVCRWHVLLEA